MDNHCVIHVIHQDIQDQVRECSLFDVFLPIKATSNPSPFLNHLNLLKEDNHSFPNHTNYSYQGTL